MDKLSTPSTIFAAYVLSKTGERPELTPQKIDNRFYDFSFPKTPEVEKAWAEWANAKEYQDFWNAFKSLTTEMRKRKTNNSYRGNTDRGTTSYYREGKKMYRSERNNEVYR